MKRIIFVIIIFIFITFSHCFSQIKSNVTVKKDNFEPFLTFSIKPAVFIPVGRLNEQFNAGAGLSIQGQKHMSEDLAICVTAEYYLTKAKPTDYSVFHIEPESFSNFITFTFGPKFFLTNGEQNIYVGFETGLINIFYGKDKLTSTYDTISYIGSSDAQTKFGINLNLGTDYPINKNTSLSLSGRYNIYFLRGIFADAENYWGLQLGVNFDFKR